jgi:hypothetical protein
MGLSLEELAQFAAGITSLEQFRERVIRVLIDDDLEVGDSESGTLPLMCEWATSLDMVCDVNDPNFDESEARRLAGAMCAILDQVPDEDGRVLVSPIARWAPETADRIRKYRAGEHPREAFERFVSRRPWSEDHKRAVSSLDGYELSRLADALESNNYGAVVKMLGS